VERLHSVLNDAAQLVLGSCTYERATPLLRDLHGCRVHGSVIGLPSSARTCAAVPFLADELQRVADVESWQRLRSVSTTRSAVPVVSSTLHSAIIIGDRTFPIAAVRVWNSFHS